MTTTNTTKWKIVQHQGTQRTCACGEIIDITAAPENVIHGTARDREAEWYGCTRRGHRDQAVAIYRVRE